MAIQIMVDILKQFDNFECLLLKIATEQRKLIEKKHTHTQIIEFTERNMSLLIVLIVHPSSASAANGHLLWFFLTFLHGNLIQCCLHVRMCVAYFYFQFLLHQPEIHGKHSNNTVSCKHVLT